MTNDVADEWLKETQRLIDYEWEWSGERDRLQIAVGEIGKLRKALYDASYALFQIKRMVPEAIPAFARAEYDKACAVLDGDSSPERT
jgi:hypothetical protein